MRTTAKNRSANTRSRARQAAPRSSRKVKADPMIRRTGDEWARHWNAGELEGVVEVYAEDAV